MKKIKITPANTARIDEAIAAIQGKATARTISAADVIQATAEIERRLDICKKDMTGIIARVDIHAQDFPSAYKYTPYSTHFEIERGPAAWYVTEIRRGICIRVKYSLTLTDTAKTAIVKRFETMTR